MGGPSAHGQRNKAHKAGRRAGLSARDKHKVAKQGGAAALGAQRRALKRSGASGDGGSGGGKKLQRALASKQQRDSKKAGQAARRRAGTGAPMVVAVLPLCSQADARAFWEGAIAACGGGGGGATPAPTPSFARDDAKRRAAAAAVGMDVEEADAAALFPPGVAVTCAIPGRSGPGGGGGGGGGGAASSASAASAVRLTWLCPPGDRADPLAVVDIARAADAIVLLTAAGGGSGGRGGADGGGAAADAAADGGAVDADGAAALAVLRAMGLPHVVAAVQQRPHRSKEQRSRGATHAGGDAMMLEDDDDEDDEEQKAAGGANAASNANGGGANMKARSAARKAAERALARHLPAAAGGGQLRLLPADTPADFAALVRHLADRHPPAPPGWRQARGQVMVERVEFCPSSQGAAAAAAGAGQAAEEPTGTLFLTGYVRGGALCADQPVCVPGLGDFAVVRVEAPPAPAASAAAALAASAAAVAAIAGPAPLFPVVAEPETAPGDGPLERMNAPPDALDGGEGGGEQTWPTGEELEAAERRRLKVARRGGGAARRRQLPAGTSEYQAAWLLDEDEDEDGGDEEEDEEDEEEEDAMMDGEEGGRRGKTAGAAGKAAHAADDDEPPLLLEDDDGDYGMGGGGAAGAGGGGGGAGGGDYDEDEEDPVERAALLAQLRGASAGRATAAGGVAPTAAAAADVAAAAEDDGQWPDEIELAPGVAARVRLAKYRALKSLRAGAWDPSEGTPAPYARVFAFENAQRAAKRAKQAAADALARAQERQQKEREQARRQGGGGAASAMAMAAEDSEPARSVPPGTYVRLALARVPEAGAARLAQRVQAALCGGGGGGGAVATTAAAPAVGSGGAPPVAFGLLEHESKLSVLNLALRRPPLPQHPTAAQSRAAQPLANKAPLLVVAGGRAFVGRPVFSDDHHGAELHRMARYLRSGESAVATVYGPISHGPMPVLAFRLPEGHPLLVEAGAAGAAALPPPSSSASSSSSSSRPVLAATGSLRSVDPDRVVLKRAVLTGYPVRTHKSKAVVRFMFGSPDDVRWFAPAELWTRSGRRGRIAEPLGTHGAFKARFDGPVAQRDAVCISLYKRVFPKWPGAGAGAAGGAGQGGAMSTGGGPGGEGFEPEEAVIGRDGGRFALL